MKEHGKDPLWKIKYEEHFYKFKNFLDQESK